MNKKPTYEELEQISRKLEKEIKRRKKAEEALQESEEIYREAYEIIKRSPAVTFLWKNEEGWPVEFVSENVEELLGFSADDFISGRVLYAKVVHPGDLERVAGEVAKFSIGIERKRFTHEPYRIVTKDGKIKWLADRTYIRRDEKGRITHYHGIVLDKSSQMQVEKELEARTNDLNERVKELNCLYGISKLVEKRNISLEEIIQRTVDLIPMAWRYPQNTCARIIVGDKEFKTKNFRKTDLKQACDIIVHGELSGTVDVFLLDKKSVCQEEPFLKEEMTLLNTIARRLVRITERIRAEKEIITLKEKYEDLYHNAPIMYLSLDTNGNIIECNNLILNKLGYTRGEIAGKHMMDIVTKESAARFKEHFPELIKTGKLIGLERQLVTKNGDILDVQLSVTGEYDIHGKMIKTRASFEDISGLKRVRNQIHSLTHELMNAHESERQIISRELHDRIAQDLSTLKIGFDTLLYNQNLVSPEDRQKAVEFSKIFKNTIAAVRDLSYELRPPLLDEMGLVEAIFNFCESFSKTHGVNVQFSAAGMDNLRLNFETEINLYRLIQEGINNISKHAEATDAYVKLLAASPNILLRIEDNGRGFDVERRLEALTNEKRMGLRSMEERTHLLEGKMTVKSFPSKGTKILIKIPQRKGKNDTKENDTDR
jgi:PAS domain S-box-containing protein